VNSNGRTPIRPSVRHRIFMRDDYMCQLCKSKGEVNNPLELDHIIPVAEGGSDIEPNLRVLCFQCNRGRVVDIDRQRVKMINRKEDIPDKIMSPNPTFSWRELLPKRGRNKLFSKYGIGSLFRDPYKGSPCICQVMTLRTKLRIAWYYKKRRLLLY